jgi:CheY-like chemotaxis protein
MRKILIVEDENAVRSLVSAFVEHTDKFDIIDSVVSGEDAMLLFEPGKYAVAIIDLNLICMSGAEVSLLIRRQDKNIHIIGITGYKDLSKNEYITAAGFNKMFIKPFGYKDFFSYIDGLYK